MGMGNTLITHYVEVDGRRFTVTASIPPEETTVQIQGKVWTEIRGEQGNLVFRSTREFNASTNRVHEQTMDLLRIPQDFIDVFRFHPRQYLGLSS